MRELSKQECKEISLDILIDIADYCQKNNLTYYLSVGTLLGCIRHKGFIPWDDDIDIMMPRGDYRKLIDNYDGKYKIIDPHSGILYYSKAYDPRTVKYEPGVDYHKHKPYGVDIDIFPLDGIVNDKEILEKMYKKDRFLELLLRLSNQPIFLRKNPLKAINRIIPRIIGSKNIVRMIEKNAMRYDYETSDYVMRMRWSPHGFAGALPKEVYDIAYGEFEGHKFIIPKGYDLWLRTFFGDDYMVLPPEDKRTTHYSKCYLLEDGEDIDSIKHLDDLDWHRGA